MRGITPATVRRAYKVQISEGMFAWRFCGTLRVWGLQGTYVLEIGGNTSTLRSVLLTTLLKPFRFSLPRTARAQEMHSMLLAEDDNSRFFHYSYAGSGVGAIETEQPKENVQFPAVSWRRRLVG